jgi:peptide/nickel transport system permease protein
MAGSIRASATSRPQPQPEPSRLRLILRRLGRHYQGLIGAAIILAVILTAILAPVIATHAPDQVDVAARLSPPSVAHYFGTDNLGRDIFSRVVYGSRISILAGFVATSIAVTAGTCLGLLSGYLGGYVDHVMMRLVDAFMAFPGLVLMIGFAAVFGPGLVNAMVAIGMTSIPGFTRLVRGQVLAIRERDFVESARATGATAGRIAWRHVLPNILPPIIVWASLGVAGAILAEAGLSFLGLGTQPPTASWGSMVNQGNSFLSRAPWMAVFPGAAIFLTVLGANLLGDALRDAWDPRLRGY